MLIAGVILYSCLAVWLSVLNGNHLIRTIKFILPIVLLLAVVTLYTIAFKVGGCDGMVYSGIANIIIFMDIATVVLFTAVNLIKHININIKSVSVFVILILILTQSIFVIAKRYDDTQYPLEMALPKIITQNPINMIGDMNRKISNKIIILDNNVVKQKHLANLPQGFVIMDLGEIKKLSDKIDDYVFYLIISDDNNGATDTVSIEISYEVSSKNNDILLTGGGIKYRYINLFGNWVNFEILNEIWKA